MGADDDDDTVVERQMSFLEDYEKGTAAAQPSTQAVSRETRRRPRRSAAQDGVRPAGKQWVQCQSWLDVAEYALRACVSVRGREHLPPQWLSERASSQAATVRFLANQVEAMYEP